MIVVVNIFHPVGLATADIACIGVLLCSEEHFDELLHNVLCEV